MKRFILSVLFAAVFCIGLGGLVQTTGAKFKSDEKALALVRQARTALGGESAVSSVKSLTISGKTTRIAKVDGVARNEENETEIAMRLPNEMMKSFKMDRKTDGALTDKTFERRIQVDATTDGNAQFKVIGDGDGKNVSKVIIRKDDGTTQVIEGNGDKAATGNVMIRKSDGGTGTMVFKTEKDGKVTGPDGQVHDVIIKRMDDGNATFKSEDGKTFTVTTDKGVMVRKEGAPEEHQRIMMNHGGGAMITGHGTANNSEMTRLMLGLLLTAPEGSDVDYQLGGEADVEGTACNVVVAGIGGQSYKIYLGKSSNLPVMIAFAAAPEPQVFTFRTKAPDGTAETKDMTFTRRLDPTAAPLAQYQIRFSDFRTVDGVQLPYRWTTTVNGEANETFDVSSFALNPANIGEKFGTEGPKFRVKKDGN